MTDGIDPRHMEQFCSEILPSMLTEACGVVAPGAARVAADIRLRAEAVAHLDQVTREVLATPFFEEAFFNDPPDAPPWLKALTTLAVRNSQLEQLHADGPVNGGGITVITTYALGPLSHLMAARRRQPNSDGNADSPFTGLAEEYPRAWECLTALRQGFNTGGGRVGYTMPAAPPPKLPLPEELTEAPTADHLQSPPSDLVKTVVFSGIDPRFDQTTIAYLKTAQEGDGLLLGLSSLSRISRNSRKLLRVLDFLLAYEAKIITTNTLLTSKDVWARSKHPIKPNSEDIELTGLGHLEGLSGSHRKTVETYMERINRLPRR